MVAIMHKHSRWSFICTICLSALVSTLIASGPARAEPKFRDPLDHPATAVTNLSKRPFQAVVLAGSRLVAVGSRGLIVVSNDGGRAWTQAKVPVQSDLLAVHFPTPTTGWAVGHDGVVLRSDDGGDSWVKQLDGRMAAESFRQFYQVRASTGDEAAKRALQLIDQNFKVPASLPYLDVWFESAANGYAVGSFGMLIATTDGGKTWVPWMDRINNEQNLNLNAVRSFGGDLLVVGERGQIYKLDRDKGRFIATATGYAGSFFGLAANANTMLAFGLRGVVYRSGDKGNTWQPVNMPSEATISSGVAQTDGAGFVLVNGAGQLLIGDRSGRRFSIYQPAQHMRLTGVVAMADRRVMLTGLTGIAAANLLPAP